MQSLREIDATRLSGPQAFQHDVLDACQPMVLRNLVRAWPVVHAATRSDEDLRDYLVRLDNGGQADAFIGERSIAGKYYYREGLEGFNLNAGTWVSHRH